MQPRIKAF